MSASFARKEISKSEGSYRQNYHVGISVFILRNGLVLPLRQVFATPLILLSSSPRPPQFQSDRAKNRTQVLKYSRPA
jgi:hypothetical protein